MKKISFFSRMTAAVLTLAMLLPCVLTAPVSAADPAVRNIWHYKAVANDTGRKDFVNKIFPNNVVNMHGSDGTWRTFRQYTPTFYFEDGPKKLATQAMQLGTSPSHTYATDSKYSGRPVEILYNNTKASKLLDGIRFELGGVTYPIITRGMGALNISFVYAGSATSLGLMDEFRVYVSLDGKTYLKEGAGIRSHKLLAGGTSGSSTFYLYQLETESLFDIDGLDPGTRIMKIMIEPLEPDTTQAGEIQFYTMDLNAYNTKADFERLVPKDVRRWVHVGEDVMRQIVVEEGQRTANVAWHTDTVVHAITGSNHIVHMPGIEYRGGTYERDTDSSRELMESAIVDGMWMGGVNQDNFYGMDCQTFVFNAVSRVSRAMGWACQYTPGAPGLTLLGKEFLNLPDKGLVTFTNYDIIRTNTQQDIFRSYALAKPGDQEVTYTTNYDGTGTSGSHVRVVVDNHTEYNADGTINGEKSYFISTEQAMFAKYEIELADGSLTSYSATGSTGYQKLLNYLDSHPGAKVLYGHSAQADSKQSYNALYNGDYAVYTNTYYPAGDIELENPEIIFAPCTAGKSFQDGGVAISCVSNYRLIGWGTKLEDLSTGEVLYDTYSFHAGSNSVFGRHLISDVLNAKMAELSNGTYRLSFSVDSGPFTALGQTKVPTTTKTYDFTITDRSPADEIALNVPASASKGQTFEVPVVTSANTDSADVKVKFDPDVLTFKSAATNDNVLVSCNKGMITIMAADAGVTAGGQITKLTFTSKDSVSNLKNVIQLKSAMISTADAANTADATKATDGTEVSPSINFADVNSNSWYGEAVDYVVANNVMSGYSASSFGPNDTLSRAMVVQVLYNKENKPATEAQNLFPDVKAGDWFFNAVRWGANKGVVSGYGGGVFKPDDAVTLEQVAVILHNYSGKPTSSASISGLGSHSDWAEAALRWCSETGVLTDVPFTSITGRATRAQTAQMLTNFLKQA